MGDWERRESQHAPGLRQVSQFRSQSLPRLNSSQVDVSSSHGVSAAAPSLDVAARFQRAARTVGDCLTLVKGLSPEVNSARSFREKCSNLLGAAIATTLALQEALSSSYKATGSELSVQHLATDVQARLLSADALVRKYGHERFINSIVRFETKEDVERKFDGVISELQTLTNKIWDLIDPDNRIKRDVVMQGPAASSNVKTGNAFARHSLRLGSKHKVQALLAFPEEDGEGHDGVVAWAAHRNIKLVNLSSQVTTVLDGAGEYLVCMAFDRAGYIWSGHGDGTVRIWSLEGAAAAGSPTRVADAAVTAVAVDPDTGYCWAGTSDGEVVVVRFNQQGSAFGKLDIVRHLLGYDAHSPTVRSVDSAGSHASSGQPVTVSSSTAPYAHSNIASSSSSRRKRRHKSQHHHHHHHHRPNFAEYQTDAAAASGLTGLDLLESCLGTQTSGGSGRVKDTCVHSGPVSCIVISAGRAYTAGGSSSGSAALLVWDSSRFELLRTISKRSTRWCRHPTTSMTMVYWAQTRRGSLTLTSQGSGVQNQGSVTSSSGGSMTLSGVTGSVVTGTPRASSGCNLVTGHTNGSVIMWDTSGDTLKPVLLVGPERGATKQAVRSVVVLEELGILACGHANGKVYMRKLDPKTRLAPRDDANVSRWNPTTFSLQTHRLGLQQMVGCGHLLVTTGKTGSVKMWPETQLRCRASEAGIQLPHSHNPLSEAVNVLLSNAGLMAYGSNSSSLSQLANLSPAVSMAPSSQGFAVDGSAHQRQQQQQHQHQHQRHRSDGAGLPNGQPMHFERSGLSGTRSQQQQQQQRQQQQSDAAEAAAAVSVPEEQHAAFGIGADPPIAAAVPSGDQQQPEQQQSSAGGRTLQRNDSSKRWSRDLRENAWMLEWDALGLDPNKRRVVGSGSYGRVEIGSFNQTDVAVKILTDLPAGQNRPSSTTPADCPSWSEARLRALRQEVGILATLRHPNVVLFMGVCLAPPAVVTEYCPLGSLYDVLKKARNGDRGMACRLTWTRRLLMALDAARGMLYLHSHKPTILHRDLKSPNLFVTNALHVKVGDFNLSRYMSLGASFVKSSLEINPRWNAPEVIADGYYSTAADVYAFGVVLWELLTWQEPWEEEGLGSFQIMIAVQQQGLRPKVPPVNELPGQLGPAEAVSGYLALMQDCWAQNYTSRPGFEVIVTRLKVLLRMGGPNAAAGPAAAAAGVGVVGGLSPMRNASEGALLGLAAAAVGGAGGNNAAAAAGLAKHQHSRSEVVGAAAAAAAVALAGPEIADLLQLNDDDLPGPTAPAPPAAALPPIPATAEAAAAAGGSNSSTSELLAGSVAGSKAANSSSGCVSPMLSPGGSVRASNGAAISGRYSSSSGGDDGSSIAVPVSSSNSSRQIAQSISLSTGVSDAVANADAGVAVVGPVTVAAAAVGANGLPPKPRQPGRVAAAAAAAGAPAGGSPFHNGSSSSSRSPFSPFAAAQQGGSIVEVGSAQGVPVVIQQQQHLAAAATPPIPISYGASSVTAGSTAAGSTGSTFGLGATGSTDCTAYSSSAVGAASASSVFPASLIGGSFGGSSSGSSFGTLLQQQQQQTAAVSPRAAPSPIKASPFASPFAAAAGAGGTNSSPLAAVDSGEAAAAAGIGLSIGVGLSANAHNHSPAKTLGFMCSLEQSLEAASAVDASARAARHSSKSASGGGSGSASQRTSSAAASLAANVADTPPALTQEILAAAATAAPCAVEPGVISGMTPVSSLTCCVSPVRTHAAARSAMQSPVASLGAWGQQQQQGGLLLPPPPGQPAAAAVTGGSSGRSMYSGSTSSGGGVAAAAVTGAPSAAAVAAAVQGSSSSDGGVLVAGSSSIVTAATADLISLDSVTDSLPLASAMVSRHSGSNGGSVTVAGGIVLSQNNPFASAVATAKTQLID